jgi:hypothetical protein
MQCYVFWRASSVPIIYRLVSGRSLFVLGLVIIAFFILSRFLSPLLLGRLARPAELWSMTWLATLFLMTTSLLVVEIATGFGLFLKRYQALLRGLALILGVLFSLLAVIQGQRQPVVQSYNVYMKKLPRNLDGTVIVALSDLHLGIIQDDEWLSECVKLVQAERPDVILLLGDIFDGHGIFVKELFSGLGRLSAPLGVWGVLGNHDFYGNLNVQTVLFDQVGIHLLRNTWVHLSPGLVLAGIDYKSTNQNTETFMNSALDQRPMGATVLLSHAPWAEKFASRKGVDLMLSGHTHGGQIWPFGYLVQQKFPMLSGQYDVMGMTAIVSRGVGTWGPRMRLWQRSEILRMTLHTQSESAIP